MKTLYKIKYYVDQFVSYFVGFLLLFMALVVTYTVFERYFGRGVAWVEELVRAGVVWTTFLGAYVAITQKKDIKVDLVVKKMPPKMRDISQIISYICILIFLAVFTPLSFSYVKQFASYTLPMTGMTRGMLYAVFPFGACLMVIHYVLSFITKVGEMMKSWSGKESEARRS